MTNQRNAIEDLPKGSNVYTAAELEKILDMHHESEMERIDLAVLRMGQQSTITEEGIEKAVVTGIEKYAQHPLNVNSKVVLDKRSRGFHNRK